MSPLWKETTAISKEVAKEGQIPHTISGWKCVHCNVEVWNMCLDWLIILQAMLVMPGHHDEEIADADDVEEIREPFIINEATFVDIIAAASAQTHPMIMKTAAVESRGEE